MAPGIDFGLELLLDGLCLALVIGAGAFLVPDAVDVKIRPPYVAPFEEFNPP